MLFLEFEADGGAEHTVVERAILGHEHEVIVFGLVDRDDLVRVRDAQVDAGQHDHVVAHLAGDLQAGRGGQVLDLLDVRGQGGDRILLVHRSRDGRFGRAALDFEGLGGGQGAGGQGEQGGHDAFHCTVLFPDPFGSLLGLCTPTLAYTVSSGFVKNPITPIIFVKHCTPSLILP